MTRVQRTTVIKLIDMKSVLIPFALVFGASTTNAAQYELGKPFPKVCDGILKSYNGTEYHLETAEDYADHIICSATIASNGPRGPHELGNETVVRLFRTCSIGKPCRIIGLINGWSHDIWFWQRIDSISAK
jgi:hypothetical protein